MCCLSMDSSWQALQTNGKLFSNSNFEFVFELLAKKTKYFQWITKLRGGGGIYQYALQLIFISFFFCFLMFISPFLLFADVYLPFLLFADVYLPFLLFKMFPHPFAGTVPRWTSSSAAWRQCAPPRCTRSHWGRCGCWAASEWCPWVRGSARGRPPSPSATSPSSIWPSSGGGRCTRPLWCTCSWPCKCWPPPWLLSSDILSPVSSTTELSKEKLHSYALACPLQQTFYCTLGPSICALWLTHSCDTYDAFGGHRLV